MPKKIKPLLITIFTLLLVALFLNSALFTSLMTSMSAVFSRIGQSASDDPGETSAVVDDISDAHLNLLENFTSSFLRTDQYSFSGEKTIIGGASPSTTSFSCSVENDDYAVTVAIDEREIRQLYLNGIYYLINETDQIIYPDTALINFPDSHLIDACTGKVILVKEAIINSEQTYCFEIYAQNTVFELYFSLQGNLIRYSYYSDSYIITLDFTEFSIGSISDAALDLPTTYTNETYDGNIVTDNNLESPENNTENNETA